MALLAAVVVRVIWMIPGGSKESKRGTRFNTDIMPNLHTCQVRDIFRIYRIYSAYTIVAESRASTMVNRASPGPFWTSTGCTHSSDGPLELITRDPHQPCDFLQYLGDGVCALHRLRPESL